MLVKFYKYSSIFLVLRPEKILLDAFLFAIVLQYLSSTL